jgi:hypothetical protein
VESCLRQICSGGPLAGFVVHYNDMHGLWGGISVTLSGTGRYEHAERLRGAGEPILRYGHVAAEQIRELVALLLALTAWQQNVPRRPLLPDESLAMLSVRCGNTETTIFEEYARLADYQRIIKVRDWLLAHRP